MESQADSMDLIGLTCSKHFAKSTPNYKQTNAFNII